VLVRSPSRFVVELFFFFFFLLGGERLTGDSLAASAATRELDGVSVVGDAAGTSLAGAALAAGSSDAASATRSVDSGNASTAPGLALGVSLFFVVRFFAMAFTLYGSPE